MKSLQQKIRVTKEKIHRVKIWLRRTEKAVEKKAQKVKTQKEMREIARGRALIAKNWRDIKECEKELKEIEQTQRLRRKLK